MNLETLVKGLEFKVRQLADRNRVQKEEVERLKHEITGLKNDLNRKEEIIKELELNIQTLKLVKSIHKGKETADTKRKINEMLRELDRCIDLLNNTPI